MSLTKGIARTFFFFCGRDVFEGQELYKEGEDVEGYRMFVINCLTCIEDGQFLKSFNWDRLLSEITAVSCFV